jgi:hypothetical protein
MIVKLNEGINTALADPKMKARLADLGDGKAGIPLAKAKGHSDRLNPQLVHVEEMRPRPRIPRVLRLTLHLAAEIHVLPSPVPPPPS